MSNDSMRLRGARDARALPRKSLGGSTTSRCSAGGHRAAFQDDGTSRGWQDPESLEGHRPDLLGRRGTPRGQRYDATRRNDTARRRMEQLRRGALLRCRGAVRQNDTSWHSLQGGELSASPAGEEGTEERPDSAKHAMRASLGQSAASRRPVGVGTSDRVPEPPSLPCTEQTTRTTPTHVQGRQDEKSVVGQADSSASSFTF